MTKPNCSLTSAVRSDIRRPRHRCRRCCSFCLLLLSSSNSRGIGVREALRDCSSFPFSPVLSLFFFFPGPVALFPIPTPFPLLILPPSTPLQPPHLDRDHQNPNYTHLFLFVRNI